MMENLYCVSLAASVIALIFAWLQSKKVLAFSEGTPLMQKISRAIRTGASAFLKRQYRTVAVFFACMFVVLCGMAAGIMLAASVWSLLLPAIQRGQTLPLPAWIPSAVGLVLGAVGLLQVEQFAGQLLAGGAGHGGRMVLAVTLHNLPEGMVAGLAAALALTGEPDAISGALALSLGIGLQNIPEGAAVSLPLAHNGRTRSQAFFAGAASGLVEPLGALLAFALAEWVSTALPWLLSAAAGCMVCVTAQEMIPQAVEGDEPVGVVSIVLGFALMMALDVAL